MSYLSKMIPTSGELALLKLDAKKNLSNSDLCGWAAQHLLDACAKIDELEEALIEVRRAATYWEKSSRVTSGLLGERVIADMKANPKKG